MPTLIHLLALVCATLPACRQLQICMRKLERLEEDIVEVTTSHSPVSQRSDIAASSSTSRKTGCLNYQATGLLVWNPWIRVLALFCFVLIPL